MDDIHINLAVPDTSHLPGRDSESFLLSPSNPASDSASNSTTSFSNANLAQDMGDRNAVSQSRVFEKSDSTHVSEVVDPSPTLVSKGRTTRSVSSSHHQTDKSHSELKVLENGGRDELRLMDVESIKEEVREGEIKDNNPFHVGWEENDPDLPYNWPNSKRWLITWLTSLMVFAATFASSSPSSATASMAQYYHMDSEVVILVVSFFLLGYVVGPLFWAPLSETFGRVPIFVVTFGLYAAFSLGVALSRTAVELLLFRFLAGVFAASPLTNSGGVLSDIWRGHERGQAMALFTVAPFAGPVLGPLSAGFLTQTVGFRWVFWVIFFFVSACYVFMLIFLPETYGPVLLERKAAKKRAETGDDRWISPHEENKVTLKERFKVALSRPFVFLFTEPIILLMSIYVAFVYGILYLSFYSFPIVFYQGHHWSLGETGLAFIGLGIGVCAVSGMQLYFNKRYINVMVTTKARPPPEIRLEPCILGAPIFTIGLFWLAFTSSPSVFWLAPAAAAVPIGLGLVLLFSGFLNYFVDAYLQFAASALAANTVFRSLFGAGFPLFANQMYSALGTQWATFLIAVVSAVMIPIPFLFSKYGRRIRHMSHYASKD